MYYFAPQKCFAADGGLWLAACSPAAVERIERIAASDRWRPASLDLGIALDEQPPEPDLQHSGRRHARPARRASSSGCSSSAASRRARSASQASSEHLYGWAEQAAWTTPFVADPAKRSNVVGTIDLAEHIDANKVSAALRANGIVDTDSYRKLGRNQLRIGMFPAIETSDVHALTACIDHLVDHHAEALAR